MLFRSGYYIYYTRNDAMQSYMMTQRNHMVESETDIAERDQELLKKYRSRLEQRSAPEQERKPISFLYVASSLLTVAFLALGITVINSYDRLQSLETAFNRFGVMNEDNNTEDPITNVVSVNANVEPVVKDSTENSASDTATNASEDTTETETEATTEEASEATETPASEEEPEATEVSVNGTPRYYTVQDGDTLSSISFSIYHSILYVDHIMEANEMKNGDEIYVGQEILIPAIP